MNNKPLTPHQLSELEYELAQYPDIGDYLLERFGFRRLEDIPQEKYGIFRQRVMEIKNSRNGIK